MSDPNETSNNESNDDSNGCNESDNKLATYMLINKELSKTMAALKVENAKLRNNNKQLNLENLTYRNELTGNRDEIMKWRRKFKKLQAMHIQHVEMLTSELQSYANKLTGVFGNDDDEEVETEVTVRVTEQLSITTANSSSIGADPDDASPRNSKPLKSSTQQPAIELPDMLDENPSSLNTINEESEEDIEVSNSEQISLVTSTHESTLTVETTITEAINGGPNGTKRIVFRQSVSDSCEMGSMDSNKENARPSTFVNSNLTLASEDSSLTMQADETVTKSIKKSVTPFKEKFITQRRTRKRTNEQNSFESTEAPELVSSTPYKRKRSASRSELDIKSTTPVRITNNDSSSRITRRTTMSTSASGRPKRSLCPVNFVEPKLNTKMRRPRT